MSEHEAEIFRVETKDDEVLQSVKAIVQSGWPAEKREQPQTVAMHYDIRDELVIQNGLRVRRDNSWLVARGLQDPSKAHASAIAFQPSRKRIDADSRQ